MINAWQLSSVEFSAGHLYPSFSETASGQINVAKILASQRLEAKVTGYDSMIRFLKTRT